MEKTLVYQALMGTYRRLLGSEGRNSPFSFAQDVEYAKKIVLVPERGLECLILARTFLRGLRKRYPSALIAAVTPGEFSSVLEGDYWANRLYFYDDRSWNPFSRSLRDLVEQLRAGSFDIAIDLSHAHNLETYLPVSLSGACVTVGFYDPSQVFRYSISVRPAAQERPYLSRLWSLFSVLDIHPEEDIFHLPGREARIDTVWKTVGFSVRPQQDQLLGVFLDDTREGVTCRREDLTSLLKVLNTLPSKKILLAQNRISPALWEDLPRYDVLILPRETIAKVASILKECHCVLTNNIGFALLMASIGGTVIAVVQEKDVKRLSLHKIPGIRPFILRGRELPVDRLGAFIRRVMKGTVAD
jgi:ADP-heptose:LPS heptosyltransferase